jgi:hypothetical protein
MPSNEKLPLLSVMHPVDVPFKRMLVYGSFSPLVSLTLPLILTVVFWAYRKNVPAISRSSNEQVFLSIEVTPYNILNKYFKNRYKYSVSWGEKKGTWRINMNNYPMYDPKYDFYQKKT